MIGKEVKLVGLTVVPGLIGVLGLIVVGALVCC